MFEILFSAAEFVQWEQSRGSKAGKIGRCKLKLHQSSEGTPDISVKFLFEAMAECSLKTVHVMKSVYIHQCEPGNILSLELGILSRKFDLFASSVRCGESCYFVFPAQTLESPWMHVAQRLPLPALAA